MGKLFALMVPSVCKLKLCFNFYRPILTVGEFLNVINKQLGISYGMFYLDTLHVLQISLSDLLKSQPWQRSKDDIVFFFFFWIIVRGVSRGRCLHYC